LDEVTFTEIVGNDLMEGGYGGLYGVGKAATHQPRLVILEYVPGSYDETIALVGKGIVYDTGGLSLKSKDGMPGMKVDMGGSAGVLGGFMAAVQMKLPKRITLVLCLAENAIGPTAVRNDDILTLYSGKTVEVNNTDAEGRLVLADGVAYATKNIENLDLVVDMATLTGAQLVAAGKTHAGIMANSMALEQRAIDAGLRSGDLVVPLLYAPDLLMKEFDSKIADMKNSVKDRSNAQASCAGHFIEAHLDEQYSGGWLHVDMAGPADKDGRGTGYGVGLVLSLLGAPGF
jgi:probable aminopeptidase NPEPL1